MADEAFCHVCYGTSLTYENGVLVCDACGTQTQTFQEENEFQAGIDDTRGKRRAAGSSTAGQQSQATLLAREEQHAAQQLQDAALLYVRCLQQLLQAQAEVLTTRFGVSTQVTTVLRQLWLSHLPNSGMLEPTPHQPAAAAAAQGPAGQSELGGGAAGEQCDDDNDEEPSGQQQQQQRCAELVVPKNMKQLFWKLLHPQVTLQLCFLACALLREAVTHYDVICWALDGQLHYLDLPSLASRWFADSELGVLPVRCIQPEVSLTPGAFFTRSCQLAQHLGVNLPCIAGEALLLREAQELGLPKVVLDVSLQLYFFYLVRTPRMRLSHVPKAAHVAPYVWLSAAVLVAIKLLYGLGNAAGSMPLVAKAPAPPEGWQAWAMAVLDALPGITSMPLTEEEALSLSPAARQQYMHYCRHHVFAGQPTVPMFDDIQRTLLGWYDATVATPSASVSNAHAVHVDAPHWQQHAAGQPGGDMCPNLKDGGLHGSHVVGLDNYSLVMSGPSAGAGAYRLEPQLAAVVVAVAAYSRCSPATLLDCVKLLEKQMLAAEGGVKIVQQLYSAQR